MTVRNAIVVRGESASQSCTDAKSAEVGSRYQLRFDALGLSPERKTHASREAAEHCGKNLIVVAEITVHRIRDRVAAPVVAVMMASHGQEHQLLRVFDGQEPQQNLVEQRENRGICPDPKGQRQHRHRGESRTAAQRSKGVPKITNGSIHPVDHVHFDFLPSERIQTLRLRERLNQILPDDRRPGSSGGQERPR